MRSLFEPRTAVAEAVAKPAARSDGGRVSRAPIATYCFALVVIKQGRRVLLVRERDGSWSIPGGRMEPGETFAQTATREAFEESGLPIELEGILSVQHTQMPRGEARARVCFTGRPSDDRLPKGRADKESLGAQWFTREEAMELSFRSDDVLSLIAQALEGPVYPLSLLGTEQ